MLKLLKNKKIKIWGSIIAAVAVVIFASIFWGGKPEPAYEFMIIKRGELIQEVSVTGKVKPAQSVDLQFENSGRIVALNYKTGDKVTVGAVIASLDNQDSQAQVLEKEASLEFAKADLERSKKNLSSLTDPAISTALRTDLENAKINLENVKTKADDDLAADYNGAFNAMNEGMTQANSSFIVLKNIRKTYFDTGSDESRKVYAAERSAEDAIFGFYVTPNDIPGAEDRVAAANLSKTNDNVGKALKELESALILLKNSYTVLQAAVQANLNIVSTTDRDKVNTEANNVSSELSAITTAIQTVSSQKVSNDKAISDANQSLAKAQAAFPTPEDLIQKEAAVKQAQAALLSSQSQLRKTLITAPFTGIIGKVDAERGQTVSSSMVIASFISSADHQIEANITEVDIGKVKAGDSVRLTLDAYGSEAVFLAVVANIDPSETVVEGVTTYKTVIYLLNTDERLRPNMTANVDIQTDKKENVIAIPQRAVVIKNGNKSVRIDRNGVIDEVKVQTGLSGKDGFVEIVSGLNEGDRIVTFIND